MNLVSRKFRSGRYYISEALAGLRHTAEARRKDRAFSKWVRSLRSHPPDVLVGANLGEYGGVRHHIHAISKYSALRVKLAPSDLLLETVTPHDIRTTYREAFLDYQPVGIKAAHSHVYPWFIEWCGRHKGKGTRWIHTYHALYSPEYAKGELEPWQREFNRVWIEDAKHADVRLSVSRWQQRFLREQHGIETIYLPNGVDVGLCDQASADRFRREYGNDPFVLYVGRDDPVKNPADFVRLAQFIPSVLFVMIGRGLSPESLHKEWQVTIPDNLRVLGEATHAATLDAIAASAAVVVTSRREGLPTLVLEALALRKAVVVPKEPGCIEAIGDGRFGLVFEQGNIESLVSSTSLALSASSDRMEGRNHILAEYDWRVVAPRLDALYVG